MNTKTKIKLNDIKRKTRSREEFASEISPLSISGHNYFKAENHPELMEKDIFNLKKKNNINELNKDI
ncbi:MAG: hypothetical protein ACI32E_01960 [Bacilli bacterium]